MRREKFDTEAATLERRAAEMEHKGVDRGTAEIAGDLREQAADQRAFAEAARNRAHSASQAGDRLRQEAIDQRTKVEQFEADLAAEPNRREELELAVDNLEFNAGEAAYAAGQARKALELDARADALAARGDQTAADAARKQADTIREDITTRSENRELFAPEPDQLSQLGITVPASILTPPGFGEQAAVEPTPATASEPENGGLSDEQAPAPTADELGAGGDIDVVMGAAAGESADVDRSPVRRRRVHDGG